MEWYVLNILPIIRTAISKHLIVSKLLTLGISEILIVAEIAA